MKAVARVLPESENAQSAKELVEHLSNFSRLRVCSLKIRSWSCESDAKSAVFRQ